ncbi:TetR/AcrR family transcriptional regulator [Streptomyces sp. NPDC049954]|uniref:TetR/AcrR family transcriptional regulator n=1 Tax=Streptomyces sp. NPDC049954 TaxID=3155779 RepID=UPI0034139AD9
MTAADRKTGQDPDQDVHPRARPGRPTRRRGTDLTQAIYRATLEELADTSFEELRFDRIALRAGTGKAALYRRWSTTAELVLAALSDPVGGFPSRPTPPGTGSLREDLTTVLTTFAQELEELRGRALRPLLTQRPRHPELFDEILRTLIVPHQKILLAIVEQAAARGEAHPGAVTQRIASVGPRLVITESLLSGAVSGAEVRDLVDEVLLPLMGSRPRDHRPARQPRPGGAEGRH